jgi:hypothetical protein
MSDSLELKHLTISAPEMDRIIDRSDLLKRLDTFKAETIADEDSSTNKLMHETFCCKKTIVSMRDAATDDEVALISYYVDLKGNITTRVTRFRHNGTVYNLKLS